MPLRCFSVCLTLLAVGCSAPGKQVARCQAEKDELLATLKDEKLASRTMQDKVASLEARLDESEKQLAQVQKPGTRVATRVGSATAVSKPASGAAPQAAADPASLPWRQHRKEGAVPLKTAPAKPAPAKSAASGIKLTSARTSNNLSLAALAERDSRLVYDEQSGMASVDLDLPFEPGGARLSEAGRKSLDDLSKWLQSSQTSQLRVMVAGYAEGPQTAKVGDGKKNFANSRQLGTARAQAVADYLDRHGISEERLGVTGVGSRLSHLTARSGTTAAAAESVQIYIAEPDAPLVGWGPLNSKLR